MTAAKTAGGRAEVRWSFSRALLAVLSLMVWAELTLSLMRSTRSAASGDRLLHAVGLFLLLLPFFGLLVYRAREVFAFFRSVTVGVVNLVLIGLGAIIGVLFQQEDPNQPTPPAAVESLAALDGAAPSAPFTRDQRLAYQDYQSFRTAEAFFTYHLLDNLHLRGAMGFHGPAPGEAPADLEAMSNLSKRLPDLRARFGEEFAVAIESQSATGLRTRAKNAEIRALEQRWDDFWWSLFVWADRLDLRRAYRSDWFAACWTVLFLGVLSNTFRGGWRRLLRPQMWGFVITHVGVLAIIAGGFWGRLTEQRGILELNIGRSGGSFTLYQGERVPLRDRSFLGDGAPFQVRLENFRADHHDVLDVVFLGVGQDGRYFPEYELAQQPKLRVFSGKTAAYDWTMPDGEPRLRLEVLEHAKQARSSLKLRAARADEAGFPVARFRIDAPGGAPGEEGFLVESPIPDRELVHTHAPSGTRFRFMSAADPAAARARLEQPVRSRLGTLELAPDSASGAAQTMDAIPGATQSFAAAGGPFQVEILEATPDFRLESNAGGELSAAALDTPVERTAPRNPAVRVRIRAPDGQEELRWVLEEDFHRENLLFPSLALTFRWDPWGSPAERRVAFFAFPDGGVMCGEMGRPDSLQPVQANFSLALGDGSTLHVQEAFAHGTGDMDFTAVPEGDFFDASPPAIRLKVSTPGEERVLVMDAAEPRPEILAYPGPDGTPRRVALIFREDRDQGELPIEWRSRLTVLKDGPDGPREVDRGVIRVNDYFTFGGYRFFQTNHDPADPTYSGIGVVYDPGIRVVLYGLFSVMFGTIGVFLIKPLFTRRHRGAD